MIPICSCSPASSVAVGLLLPTRDAVLDGATDPAPLIELAEYAESCGFTSVWVGDSPLERPRHDALTMLAALAVRTTDVLLGTAVLLANLRHPLLLAHQAATVDLLSQGRLVLGLGSGFPLKGTARQAEVLGASFEARHRRLRDTVELLQALWSAPEGTSLTYHGRTLTAENVSVSPRPARSGGPPIWLAGGGPAALRRVGELADGWLPYPVSADTYADQLRVVQGSADSSGRPHPVAAMYATVAIDDDTDRAQAALRNNMERYYRRSYEQVAQVQAMRAGTPAEVSDYLTRYVAAGVRHVVLRIVSDDLHTAIEGIRDYITPVLRHTTHGSCPN